MLGGIVLNTFKKYTTKISEILNEIAGWGIVATMLLVVTNVILRRVFNKPILGAYEYTGFFTAIIVSFGLAYCALQNGHIAIGFILEKYNIKIQKYIHLLSNVVTLGFMIVFSWQIFRYATRIMHTGQVSPTTQTPFYIVVYVTGIGFLVLSLVLVIKTLEAFKEVYGR